MSIIQTVRSGILGVDACVCGMQVDVDGMLYRLRLAALLFSNRPSPLLSLSARFDSFPPYSRSDMLCRIYARCHIASHCLASRHVLLRLAPHALSVITSRHPP